MQRLKASREEIRREVVELFEIAYREQHEYRLDYHRGCGTTDAVAHIARDLALIRPMLVEGREQQLGLL